MTTFASPYAARLYDVRRRREAAEVSVRAGHRDKLIREMRAEAVPAHVIAARFAVGIACMRQRLLALGLA